MEATLESQHLYVLLLNSCCIRFAGSVAHFSRDLRLKWFLEECVGNSGGKDDGGGAGEDGGRGAGNACSISAKVTEFVSRAAAVVTTEENDDAACDDAADADADADDNDEAIGDKTSSTFSWLVV
jgi:hypothetical protein